MQYALHSRTGHQTLPRLLDVKKREGLATRDYRTCAQELIPSEIGLAL